MGAPLFYDTTSFTQDFRVDWSKVISAHVPLPTASHMAKPSIKRGRGVHPEGSPGWYLIPKSCLRHPFLFWADFQIAMWHRKKTNTRVYAPHLNNHFFIWPEVEQPYLHYRLKTSSTKDTGLKSVERICLFGKNLFIYLLYSWFTMSC